jgi:carbon storage regulator CsrA
MLVLSRRPSQAVLFPGSDIRLRVLEIKGNTVKIGVEAPPGVRVLRHELAARPAGADPAAGRSQRHALRNRLNKLTLALHLFRRQWQAGLADPAAVTLETVFELLEKLDADCLPDAAADQPAPAGHNRCRTLIVEDDGNERELLARLLRLNGCECETAADGQDALDYLATHDRPDFVLLDMWMPRCDGPQTLARIREDPQHRDVKVFAISGTAPEQFGVRTGPGGVDAWFPKPLDVGKLWDAIQHSLASAPARN